jgi:hypothetical protein
MVQTFRRLLYYKRGGGGDHNLDMYSDFVGGGDQVATGRFLSSEY